MKILYAVANHPQLSEQYVESEIRFVEKNGFDVSVWSSRPPGSPYPINRNVYRGTLEEAEADFKPDFVHFHWLTIACENYKKVKAPVTVRGHSFDFNASRLKTLTSDAVHGNVKKVFLFPHQAESFNNPFIESLPVGFDSSRYYVNLNKDRKQVVRSCAARDSKGLFDFAHIAKLCPEFKFILCVAEVYGDNTFVPKIKNFVKKIGSPAEVRANVPPDEMAALVRNSGISCHTLDLPQSVGMCISVAEGMASGCYSLARKVVPLSDMIANVGNTYNTVNEAAAFINDTLTWTDAKWNTTIEKTAAHAFQYADFYVFPTLTNFWRNYNADSKGL